MEEKILNNKECPKCGWQTNSGGFISTIKGAEGDWCLKCYVLKTTKGVPKLKDLAPTGNSL